MQPNFITTHGTLRTILCSIYTKSDWTVYAGKYRGTIYFYEHSDEEESSESASTSASTSASASATPEKPTSSDYYKFKQYMIAGV